MVKIINTLALLTVVLELGVAIQEVEQIPRPQLAGGSMRTKRSRAQSRYSPASSQVNPNRGRKRVRLSDGRPEVQTERYSEPQTNVASRTINRGGSRSSQATNPPRNLNRGGSRRQLNRTRPPVRNFETTTERFRATNRLTTRPVVPRLRNIENNRNFNRFFEETAVRRNELFSDSKSKYCRPGSNDYYDYDDYDRTEIQSSQHGAPLHIEVTHQLPVITQRNNFQIPNVISSVEVLAVSGLKSTDVDNLPVIYANAYTLTKQPGFKEILYDALRATETLQVTFAPTCLNGRQTSYSQISTSTIYSVETITEQIYEPVIPVIPTQNINDLLLQFLPDTTQPSPILFQPSSQLILSTAPLTSFVTHTSTYVTKITESESTELSLTFRGKPIVTTLIDTSVKEITATEFSTETVVTTQVVTQTLPVPQALNTPALAPSVPNADLEKQLLLLELSNLLSKQSIATPPFTEKLVETKALEVASETYEVTHTSTYVTTLTEKSSQVIPLTFRGKAIETTLYDTDTKVITATEYSTETLTKSIPQSPQGTNILAAKISPPQDDNLELINLLPELAEQLALFVKPTQQPTFQLNTDISNPLEAALLEEQLIEALASHINDNEIETNNENIVNVAPLETKSKFQINQEPISPSVPERQFSLTTIYKSGRSPGDFTRVVSTIYLDENRYKRNVHIHPSKKTIENRTVFKLQEPDLAQVEDSDINTNFIQSGKYF